MQIKLLMNSLKNDAHTGKLNFPRWICGGWNFLNSLAEQVSVTQGTKKWTDSPVREDFVDSWSYCAVGKI